MTAFVAPAVVAESAVMRELLADLHRSAATPATVLLIGETGTGKEVLARALHAASPRAARPFVPVNCGALPESIVESELFGNARGAFTGAGADRAGLFEEAAGGTLFLDEVGELPLATQVRLLRALQERKIRRLGEARERAVDVRVVAATNRDLGAMVADGRFREDLFFRLQVVSFRIPPLRERREDIPALAAQMLAEINDAYGRACQLEPDAVAVLAAEAWPGNVRELRHFLEQLVILARSDRFGAAEVRARLAQRARPGRPADARAGATLPATPTSPAAGKSRFATVWWRFHKTSSTAGAAYLRPLGELERLDASKALPEGVEVRVGRDAERAELVLPTDEVSRLHARISAAADTLEIEDAESRNGTFVDGQPLEPRTRHRLGKGATVRLGKEWVGRVVELSEEPAATSELCRAIAAHASGTLGAHSVDAKAFERLLSARERALDLIVTDGAVRLAEPDRPEPVPAAALTADAIKRALAAAKGNKREAARLLGISHQTLYAKMKTFGL